MTQAILTLLFSSGGFVFLSSSCGIFFARLIPSSTGFFLDNFCFPEWLLSLLISVLSVLHHLL